MDWLYTLSCFAVGGIVGLTGIGGGSAAKWTTLPQRAVYQHPCKTLSLLE